MSTVSALINKRIWYYKNTAVILVKQSTFKILFILLFVIIFETGLTWLFIDSFKWLDSFGGLGAMIISKLFSLFFLGMGIMLILSSVVTTYSTLFSSNEVDYLLTKPFSIGEIVSYKFLESTRLSSWAFFFIIIPFVGSYAWHMKMTPLFALWTLLFSIPFLVVCSALGSILTFLIVRFCPRGKFLKAILIFLGLVVLIGILGLFRNADEISQNAAFKITRLIPGLKLASNPLLPSWWISEGIMNLARNNWTRGFMLLATITTTSLMLYILIGYLGSRIFYNCWQMQNAKQSASKRSPVMFARADQLAAFLPRDIRGMIFKDLRTFCRDPLQWSQALVFFGLLGLYFANLKTFNYQHILPKEWLNSISFLNVFSVSAVMTSLGSRFVYPQLSLEGQGFWLLGLAPTSMRRIVITKFVLSLTGMLLVSIALTALSTHMLNSEPAVRITALALAGAISLTVSALSTGLGAVFLDLEERNPAAIVSGFGGTLNLSLCLGFMLLAIAPFAVTFHANSLLHFRAADLNKYLLICSAWLMLITIASTITPLALGMRSLRNKDF